MNALETGAARKGGLLGGWALCAAACASGAAALVFEMLWIRRLGEILGTSAYAIQIVLATFFAGMGLGAWFGGRIADRLRGSIGWYIALELWIAAWGFAFWPAVDFAQELCAGLAGQNWASESNLGIKALGAAIVLAAPTLAMGASLPALVRHAVRRGGEVTSGLGGIYGWNTLGAALGVVLVMFWWIPSLGLFGSTIGGALLNGAACLLAFLGRRPLEEPSLETGAQAQPSADQAESTATQTRRTDVPLLGAAMLAGFVSVGMEVLWTRALAARFLSTVFSFATILFVFLASLGGGALLLNLLEKRGLLRRSTAAVVLTLAGLSSLLSVAVLTTFGAAELNEFSGSGWWAAQRRELLLAIVVMALPVGLFGLSFPLLARLMHREVDRLGSEFGKLYLANTVGSVAAPLLLTFGLLPVIGLKWALLGCGAAAIVYGLFVLAPNSDLDRRWRSGLASTALVATAFLITVGNRVALWSEAPGDQLVHYTDGAAASVSVVDTSEGNRVLKVDNHYRLGATRSEFAQARQALVPILLKGNPRTVLALGLATGSSAGAAAAWGVPRLDIVEIIPELGQLLPFFANANFDLGNKLAASTGVQLFEVDGRHFVRATGDTYDLVLGDLFVPWRAGEGAMYTLEHFESVKEILAPGGTFCQWLPLYQLRPEDFRVIAATFCEVFAEVDAYWLYFNPQQPAVGLLGSVPGEREIVPADLVAKASLLERTGLSSIEELLASWVCGTKELQAFAAGAPLETQDRPRIEFGAPKNRFRVDQPPAAENLTLILELMAAADENGTPPPAAGTAQLGVANKRRAIAHYFRAEHLRLFQGRNRDAARELGRALDAVPDWDWIAWNLEQLIIALGQGAERATALVAAEELSKSPNFAAQGQFHTAWIKLQGGDPTGAKAAAKRALELDPNHDQAQSLLDSLP